jgi:hypothetical protein
MLFHQPTNAIAMGSTATGFIAWPWPLDFVRHRICLYSVPWGSSLVPIYWVIVLSIASVIQSAGCICCMGVLIDSWFFMS